MASLPKKISLSSLVVSEENYRFDPQTSEIHAIEMMLHEIGEKQIRLARDIVKNGLSPNEFPLVLKIQDRPTKYRVLEGNRRISALKLLKNPGIIKDPILKSRYEKRFRDLSKQMASELARPLCVIISHEEEANQWILKKHATGLNGEGIERWGTESVERYDIAVGNKNPTIGYLAYQHLKGHNKLEADRGGFALTTFNRILQTRYAQDVIGISVKNKKLVFVDNENVVVARLNTLIKRFPERRGGEGITSRSANKLEDIKELIDDIFLAPDTSEGMILPSSPETDTSQESPENGSQSENEPAQRGGESPNNPTGASAEEYADAPKQPPFMPQLSKPKPGLPNPAFFEALNISMLDGGNPNHRALKNVAHELIQISKNSVSRRGIKMKVYEAYPIATASLMRTALEQAFVLLLKMENQWNSLQQKKKGQYIMLGDLISHIDSLSKGTVFKTKKDFDLYLMVIGSACAEYLNRFIHNPAEVKPEPKALEAIARSGLYAMVDHVLARVGASGQT